MGGVFQMGAGPIADRFTAGLHAPGSSAPGEQRPAAQDRSVVVSRDGRFSAVFEGVLVNGRSLRAQVADRGHEFQTDGDTEIALAWFQRDGVAAFDRLDGAFALAIYDHRAEELLLVRDRAGQMPLHYHVDGDWFRFARHLPTVASATASDLPMCTQALEAYLQLTYIPAPWTIHEGVLKLLPGTYLRVGAGGVSDPQPYWDVDYSETNQVRDHARCMEMLREALFASVEESLQGAGHVGALLSGGIDSTIVTGIAARILDRPIDTFTIRFDDRHYDESALAQLSANLHETNHRVITLDYANVLPQLDSLLQNLDEPYADSSYIPASMVSQVASRHVETVLTGDTGDELFAGYSKYLIGRYSAALNRIPGWVSQPAMRAANLVLPAQAPFRRKMNKVAQAARLSPFEQRERLMSLGFPPGDIDALLGRPSGKNTRSLIRGHYDKYAGNTDEMRRALYLDFKVVLEGDMFPKGYYAGRPSGLRTAIPILGRSVIDVAARIPNAFKIKDGITKAILKETFTDLIPPALLKAPKTGFSMPLGSWLRTSLRLPLEEALAEDRIRDGGILNYKEVRRVKEEHLSGRADHSSKLWTLLVLQRWQSDLADLGT